MKRSKSFRNNFTKNSKGTLCNTKAEIITDSNMVNYINGKIHRYFKCSQFDHMENDHVEMLYNNQYYITLKTLGKQYFLFMTRYLRTKYCLLISREWNPTIYSIKMRFGNTIFNDTLIEGELVEDNNNTWLFLASDLYLNNGIKEEKRYSERINNLYKILTTSYRKDRCLDYFNIQVKSLIRYQDLMYLNNFVDKLTYSIKGLLFIPNSTLDSKKKSIYLQYDKFVINKVHTKEIKKKQIIEENTINSDFDNSDLGSESSYCTDSSTDDVNRQPELLKKQEHVICFANLLIKSTGKPDVYEVHTNDEQNHYYGFACLNTLKTSQLVKSLFTEGKNENGVIMKCRFHTRFRKWIPEEISPDSDLNSRAELKVFEESTVE